MSDTTDVTSGVSDVADDGATTAAVTKRRRGGTGLSAMLLPELQSLAASLGISGTARMRKGELITAISERQNGGAPAAPAKATSTPRPRTTNRSGATAAEPVETAPAAVTKATAAQAAATKAAAAQAPVAQAPVAQAPVAQAPVAQAPVAQAPVAQAPAPEAQAPAAAQPAAAQSAAPATEQPTTEAEPVRRSRRDQGSRDQGSREQTGREQTGRDQGGRDQGSREQGESRRDSAPVEGQSDGERNDRGDRPERGEPRNRDRQRNPQRAEVGERNDRSDRGSERPDRGNDRNDRGPRTDGPDDEDGDNGEGGRRSRRSRFRDRRRGRDRDGEGGAGVGREGGRDGGREGGGRDSGRDTGREPHVNEDDVLVPVAGILDVLDNYAFVRTTGYLSGPNDVYVSMSQVKKHGLRRGDAVTGAVRAAARDSGGGDQRRDKYNPLVRLDTINGMEPEEARRRPEFYKLTPLYPQERLRLETEAHILTTRVIDLVMPLGKGQRALIVSPPKAGKTMVLQAIANAITHNNPECHLMVVLVDERPEEVTDMQRSVKGEVIAATFDRPPQDHTTVAELAIERAKRLVELGHDVVVLLDSVTRLGRSYNLAAPASGRIMSGGIDSTALYPPKRFLGAARNIENGGSLTILATALVETGSMMDTVIFEEFKGTGNAELKLDRKIADRRTFPAIDIHPSGTRKEEILLGKEELAIVHKLRKVLSSLESSAALDLLLDRLKQSRTNIEFLMQIAKSTPGE
ncbi:transcription termination factor Rho [Actinoplanes sp. ATCC 53533]|uniref:transcription termination factor Rho n=1 Tax=Actinoplanes sp. ATCC 53533 TaxID=1288362 RepID=UPI000F794487|nr:transcription termination factor Rho [Actinoplanes sp. ATCC 53533]RSM56630.1 transcription termination factor Rho [Actinoplanes sp. ATCC 53533]